MKRRKLPLAGCSQDIKFVDDRNYAREEMCCFASMFQSFSIVAHGKDLLNNVIREGKRNEFIIRSYVEK